MSTITGFAGRTVFVAGGAAGIGRGLGVEAFAARGALVHATDINQAGLDALGARWPARVH